MGPYAWNALFFFLLIAATSSPDHVHFYKLNRHHNHGLASFRSHRVAPGLSFDFYKASCPQAHHIIARGVRERMLKNPSEAAGLLRILFHDCFVQGCDASILLEGPFSEQNTPPNNASLRMSSIKLLDTIKEDLEWVCPGIVSCADVIALAAREAVFLAGGPLIPMPSGRRDSQTPAPNKFVLKSLPTPLDSFAKLHKNFMDHGLNLQDLVALSGGHSIGEAHCRTVDFQLFPKVSPDIAEIFVHNISKVCLPTRPKAELTIHLDFLSKDHFDNNYFKNVLAKRALFHSDSVLMDNPQSKKLVELYAQSQAKFFEQFSVSMLKLSQTLILTGHEGEVRRKCTT